MADKAVSMQASDLFALGANFKEQSSTSTPMADHTQVRDENGNSAGGCLSGEMNNRTEYTGVYLYCGTDLKTDLGTLLTTFGQVSDSKAVTEISVNFTQDQKPEVTINGHNHDDNPHTSLTNFDVAASMPAGIGGVGVPDWWTNSDANSNPTRGNVRYSLTHTDRQGKDNQHWVGDSRDARVDASFDYIGTPTLTLTGWETDSKAAADSNSEFDTFTQNAHRFYDQN
jgi:hypothetical protein